MLGYVPLELVKLISPSLHRIKRSHELLKIPQCLHLAEIRPPSGLVRVRLELEVRVRVRSISFISGLRLAESMLLPEVFLFFFDTRFGFVVGSCLRKEFGESTSDPELACGRRSPHDYTP